MGKNVRITVVKKAFFEDLAQSYLADGVEAGACPEFEVGDTFVIDGDSPKQPEGFCIFAWQSIFFTWHSIRGGASYTPWWNKEHMQVACCTDGTRPVSFLIEMID